LEAAGRAAKGRIFGNPQVASLARGLQEIQVFAKAVHSTQMEEHDGGGAVRLREVRLMLSTLERLY